MAQIKQIIFPKEHYDVLIEHCRRKFNEQYLPEESRERKAYGLIGGKQEGDKLVIGKVFALHKNARKDEQYDEEMTKAMYEFGTVSKTPFERRGWVADPQEVFDVYEDADSLGLELFAAYHMHIVSWPPHDLLRDIPTEIDTVLAKDSNMYIFIISLVDPAKPIVRAFFESRMDMEVPIILEAN